MVARPHLQHLEIVIYHLAAALKDEAKRPDARLGWITLDFHFWLTPEFREIILSVFSPLLRVEIDHSEKVSEHT